MATLSEISAYIGDLLSVKTIGDYPQALNGLQLENNGRITRIAAAVDACEAVLVQAARSGADLLLVHHGLFWNTTPFTGGMYRKMKAAIQGNLAVYSAHLPLDVHPLYGNNALLSNAIGLHSLQPFFPSKGQPLGLVGQYNDSRTALVQKLSSVLEGPVHLCPGGPEFPKCVGVITGGAGSEVAKVAAAGVDT
ncbi:MAG: Nif3-like dinuclear metal center hexameric protein, partial [Verrucomicrobia bacterium]|nr:Nif3-like dinuclear metal center hexameric protein [Verrucomicrobiota bacterium]